MVQLALLASVALLAAAGSVSGQTVVGAGCMADTRAVPAAADAPLWPNAFSINFSAGSSSGKMWYDADKQIQRLDHKGGAYECQRFYNASSCTLWMTPDGLYRNASSLCCLDMPAIHNVPANWLISNGYALNHTYSSGGHTMRQWRKAGLDTHFYSDTEDTVGGFHVPAQFTFPEKTQTMNFDVASFSLTPPPATVLNVPQECKKSCN
eukprot:PLAT15652.1.p1 GENE.PLAT15652.1~~PLAT15652.1.p1  ORF type:complete len:226 (-),score=64.48 PLAT15652.1:847-1470(-)